MVEVRIVLDIALLCMILVMWSFWEEMRKFRKEFREWKKSQEEVK